MTHSKLISDTRLLDILHGKGAIAQFEDLCTELRDAGLHWLYPRICWTYSSDWEAAIYKHQNFITAENRLTYGQDSTLEGALRDAIRNFVQLHAADLRKQQLLAIPSVVEALELFGVKIPE